jgi:hypothetical protein
MGTIRPASLEPALPTPPVLTATKSPVAGKQAVSAQTSLNYSVAKVIAIFTVVAGHWFTGTILWIPVTFGLFVFAFSSGFFTSAIYGPAVDRRRFWRKKLERLGLRYWIILAFLAVVVALKGKTIFHWHTLVHAAGLSGVLNWAAIPNRSGLGAGLWFFTLLLVFYIAYPYLARLAQSRSAAVAATAVAFASTIYLEENVKVGHELWLTSFGFIAGVMFGAREVRLAPHWLLAAALGSCIALLGVNLSGYKSINTILITTASLLIALWLARAELPQWRILHRVAALDKYLLEIFLIHTYLFLRPTGHTLVDFLLSLVLIVTVCVLVSRMATWATTRVFDSKGGPG